MTKRGTRNYNYGYDDDDYYDEECDCGGVDGIPLLLFGLFFYLVGYFQLVKWLILHFS